MTRLIDADVIPWDKAAHVEGFQTVRKMAVDNMPTVDAIPVEWIKNYIGKANDTDAYAVVDMLSEWEEEDGHDKQTESD